MSTDCTIPWAKYAIIAYLAKELKDVRPNQFGKTALQKLLYLLQEVYKTDLGYNFTLYTYGPFDSQILSDLDMVERIGGVEVDSVASGFSIVPHKNCDQIIAKANNFINCNKTAINSAITTYGSKQARELELISTIVYVCKDQRSKGKQLNKNLICTSVSEIKPKFLMEEIGGTFEDLLIKKAIS